MPSMAVFQAIWVESFQVVGIPFSVDIPFRSLPLKWVQEGALSGERLVQEKRAQVRITVGKRYAGIIRGFK